VSSVVTGRHVGRMLARQVAIERRGPILCPPSSGGPLSESVDPHVCVPRGRPTLECRMMLLISGRSPRAGVRSPGHALEGIPGDFEDAGTAPRPVPWCLCSGTYRPPSDALGLVPGTSRLVVGALAQPPRLAAAAQDQPTRGGRQPVPALRLVAGQSDRP
jgi:hypothetical protein